MTLHSTVMNYVLVPKFWFDGQLVDRYFCPLRYIDFEFVHLLLLVQMHSTGNLAPNSVEKRWRKEGPFIRVNHSLNGWNLVITVIEPSLFSFKHQNSKHTD